MKEKEIPLEERIEQIFESGWVNEFNYLENLMQETRSCLYKLQQELRRKDNIINNLKEWLENYIQIMSSSLSECDKQYTEALQNILFKINELEGDNK